MGYIKHYTLDHLKQPVLEPDLLTWAIWFENGDRVVKQECIGPREVSTVFLGLDHSFEVSGEPVLWETMIFSEGDDELNQYQRRCSGTFQDAMAMHGATVAMVRSYEQTTRNNTST
jgi:hypothetical protein